MLKERLQNAVAEPPQTLVETQHLEDLISNAANASRQDPELQKLVTRAAELTKERREEEQTAVLVTAVRAYLEGGELFTQQWNVMDEMVGDEIVEVLEKAVKAMLSRSLACARDLLNGNADATEIETAKRTTRLCFEVLEVTWLPFLALLHTEMGPMDLF